MNVDNNSDPDKKEVKSKYFTKKSMDESLSDFQEIKKNHSGPKSSKPIIKKPRKVAKKPKGQRDIRTALKSKKNDLVAYTEKFDTECKKAGIDVDTEELQLAIALSKSLQTESNVDCSKQISSQERVRKIRTTLQEYGFKVPEGKITSKKVKKHKKDYKLVSKSVSEKEQVISDKYSQVLFSNADESNLNQDLQIAYFSLFNKATNISYEHMKSNDIYYIENLVARSSSNGCLLRDWNKIPGRPASPVLNIDTAMNCSEIACSQEELDAILSGPMKKIKKALSLKKTDKVKPHTELNNKNDQPVRNTGMPDIVIEINGETPTDEVINVKNYVAHRSCSPDIFDDEESVIECLPPSTIQDETNEAMDFTECVSNVFQKNCQNTIFVKSHCAKDITKRKSNDFMDLTECVATSSQPLLAHTDGTKNLNDNGTLIKENNLLLDLTQSSNSLDSLPEVNIRSKENLEATVILSADDYNGIETRHFRLSNKSNSDAVYDLTQDDEFGSENKVTENNLNIFSSNNEATNTVQNVDAIYLKVKGNTSIINENTSAEILDSNFLNTDNSKLTNEQCIQKAINLDVLLDNSNDSDKTVVIPLGEEDNSNNISQKSHGNTRNVNKNDLSEENQVKDNNTLDLTQSSTEENGGIFENYTFEHSPNSSNNRDKNIPFVNEEVKPSDGETRKSVEVEKVVSRDTVESSKENVKDIDNIDLTQSPNASNVNEDDTSVAYSIEYSFKNYDDIVELPLEDYKCSTSQQNNSIEINNDIVVNTGILSKENNVQEVDIDLTQPNILSDLQGMCDDKYAEHTENSNDSDKTVLLEEYTNLGPRISSRSNENNSTYNNEVIEIDAGNNVNSRSDNNTEGNTDVSDCSQHPEVFEIIDNELDYSLVKSRRENFYDGVEILDDLPNQSESINSESLPLVEVKDKENDLRYVTPKKNTATRIETVTKSGYIIKYDASPMPNYAAMTSPERLKELDKYGLKPFKRKRAIQLLTHIYNQTHPTIESIEDMQSPTKRFKKNTTPPLSPRKIIVNLPKNSLEMLEEVLDIFQITNETPEIKEIECPAEDWMFQKREKAKVHSCRVPLHIAFHNYVSCRRFLREAILRYEPIEIDVIHKQLVSYGHRYDPKDLLKFMDKKCITVKTNDNNNRNK